MAGSEDDGLDVDAARQDGAQERPGLGAHALSVLVHGALRTVSLLRSGRMTMTKYDKIFGKERGESKVTGGLIVICGDCINAAYDKCDLVAFCIAL